MNPFEKEYKNRFEEAKSTDGIDPGAIWENISNALPEEDVVVVAKRNFFDRNRYLLLLLLLVFTGLGGFFFMTKENTPIAETENTPIGEKPLTETVKGEEKEVVGHADRKVEEEDNLKLNERAKNDLEKPNQSDENINEERAKNSISPDEDSTREAIIAKSNIETDENAFVKTKIENGIESRKTEDLRFSPEETRTINENIVSQNELGKQKDTDSLGKKTEQQKEGLVLVEESKNAAVSKSIELEESKESEENISITTGSLSELLLPIAYGDFPFAALRDLSKVDRKPTIPVEPKGRNRNMKVGVFAGLVGWSSLFQNNSQANTKKILEEATSVDLGQSIAISLQWNLTKKIHLSTGFEYLNTRTEFNYIEEWDTLAVVPDYESLGLIDAIATRKVKHNNQQKILSVPIMIGTSKDFAAFELGVELGLGLNYIISQKGMSLDTEGSIAEYDSKDNNGVPYRQFFLSYQLQPYLSYAVTERFSFQLQPIFRYQQHGNSNLYGSDISSFSWGLRFGGVVGF
jgi:hypothetical protein